MYAKATQNYARRPSLRLAPATLAVALVWGAVAGPVFANPSGGVAIQGQATMATNGNKLLVTTQNGAGTNHSAINWQSFSIPAGNTTYFQQPSVTSTVINRVVTATPSLIFGTLGSNGNVVLVNQSGITVGAGAIVDTAGFTASALRMSDADAIDGRLRFGDDALAAGGGVRARQHSCPQRRRSTDRCQCRHRARRIDTGPQRQHDFGGRAKNRDDRPWAGGHPPSGAGPSR